MNPDDIRSVMGLFGSFKSSCIGTGPMLANSLSVYNLLAVAQKLMPRVIDTPGLAPGRKCLAMTAAV